MLIKWKMRNFRFLFGKTIITYQHLENRNQKQRPKPKTVGEYAWSVLYRVWGIPVGNHFV